MNFLAYLFIICPSIKTCNVSNPHGKKQLGCVYQVFPAPRTQCLVHVRSSVKSC